MAEVYCGGRPCIETADGYIKTKTGSLWPAARGVAGQMSETIPDHGRDVAVRTFESLRLLGEMRPTDTPEVVEVISRTGEVTRWHKSIKSFWYRVG